MTTKAKSAASTYLVLAKSCCTIVLYLNEKLIFEVGLEAAGLIALGDLGCKSKKMDR